MANRKFPVKMTINKVFPIMDTLKYRRYDIVDHKAIHTYRYIHTYIYMFH